MSDDSADCLIDQEEILKHSEDLSKTFGNQLWRLNNLYHIQTKEGPVEIFRMQPMQRQMYTERWWRNIVLKVRQIGSSTLWCLFILDSCLFSKDPVRAGIIAQTRPKAKELLLKCAFAFERLDPAVVEAFNLTMKGGGERLDFGGGASITSGITMRSQTIDLLLISEMGKLAAEYPSKAREVITGTLPTIPSRGLVVMESTAEGHDGIFFDMVENAGEIQDNPKRMLGTKDMRLHFFPWWERPEYADDDEYELTDEHKLYFEKLRLRGILLNRRQKNWWARNKDVFTDSMASEYPSYREEAFQVGGKGLYLAKAMLEAEDAGNVGAVAHDPGQPCVTAWDLGNNTAIWIYQYRSPIDRWYLDYLEGEGGDFDHWAGELQKLADRKGYRYGAHVFPWDGKKMQGMKDTYKAFAEKAGLVNVEVLDVLPHEQQVRYAKAGLTRSFFDLEGTMTGRKRILGYRRRFDRNLSDFADDPVKNLASHGAEAFMTSCLYAPTNLFMPKDNSDGASGSGGRSKGKDGRGVLQKMLGLKGDRAAMTATDARPATRGPLTGLLARLGLT